LIVQWEECHEIFHAGGVVLQIGSPLC
jgi:hypothetical protein